MSLSIRSVFAGLALALAATVAAAPASAALMQGQTLKVEYLYPDLNTQFAGPLDITGGGAGVTMFIGSDMTVTLGDDTIYTSEDDFVGGFYNPAQFNGLHIWDANNVVAPFTSVSLLHNDYLGFNMSRVSFDADNIFIDFTGLNFTVSPSVLSLQVNGGGAPEPAAWALMISGFGLTGATLRRRRRAVRVRA
jgi:hypothetical protein